MSSTVRTPHIVIPVPEVWGHARPLCAFASRVALNRDVHITVLTPIKVYNRIKSELSRAFGPKDAERLDLVRVVGLDSTVEGITNPAEAMKEHQKRFLAACTSAYKHLAVGRSVVCAATQAEIPAVPAPSAVVIDFMVTAFFQVVRKISKEEVKILMFTCGMVSFTYLGLAPRERGGRADVRAEVLKIAESSGRPVDEVADEIYHTFTDEITQIPGFPKMYHWEFDPQDTAFMTRGFLGGIWLSLIELCDNSDGMIISSPEAYEPEAIKATKEWFAASGNRPVWAIGPLLPSTNSEAAVAGEEAQSDSFGVIKKFMDDTLASHGEHSMLYISFGSAFWPSQADKLEAFVDTVIELNIPFIFSHASPVARLSDSLRSKVEQFGSGLLSSWSPQQTILNHPALGWFVTHGGHNSSLEAASSGVPVICWPFHADQPANAVILTEIHDVAYELIEVRTGNGLKPRLRTGTAPLGTVEAVKQEAHDVLTKAFGEDGARKRKNAKELQHKVESAWNKGGSATVDMALFLNAL